MLHKRLLSAALVLTVTVSGMVGCMDAGDEGDLSDTDTLVENLALAPPANLTVTIVSPTRMNVSWDAVVGASYYVLYRGTAPNNETAFTSVNGTTFVANYLTPGGQYCWKVRDVNPAKEASGYSSEVCATTPSSPTTPIPTNVVATATSDSRITLTWAAVTGATAYQVYMAQGANAFNYVTTYAAPTTTHFAANLTPSTTYSFYVKAVAPSGISDQSAIATATTFALGLEGFWKFDETAGTTSADSSGFGRNATFTGAAFSTDRPPIAKNKSVLSVSTVATSAASVPATSVFRFAGGAFALSMWVKLPAAVDTDFIGMRAAACGTLGWKIGQTTAGGLTFSGGGGSRAFGSNLTAGTWTHLGVSFASGTLTLYVNGVQSATGAYTPSNSLATAALSFGHVGGCAGGAALVDQVRIFSRALTAQEMASYGKVPPAPTDLVIASTDSSHQKLTWTAVPNATLYFVYKGTASGNQTFLTSVAATTPTYTGQHLTPSTQYSWYVRSEIGELDSNNSAEVIGTTLAGPVAPTNLTATAISSSRINLAWTAVSGAVSYQVYQSINGGAFAFKTTVTGTTAQIAGLTTMTPYSYYVIAVDVGLTQSPPSATASATTL